MRPCALLPTTAAPCSTSSSSLRRSHAPQQPQPLLARPPRAAPRSSSPSSSSGGSRRSGGAALVARSSHRVQLELADGSTHYLNVEEGQNVLEVVIDQGLDVPYDCTMGVCLRCAAKVEEGDVDQDAGMLSDDVVAKGYALLCVSLPRSDCKIRVIPEEDLMDEAMATSAAAEAAAKA